jgi:hypothetical protein
MYEEHVKDWICGFYTICKGKKLVGLDLDVVSFSF